MSFVLDSDADHYARAEVNMKAFLAGLGIGIGLGILFAPDNGEVSRGKVRQRLDDWRERLSRHVDRAKQTVTHQSDLFSQHAVDREAPDGEKKEPARAESSNDDVINTGSRDELMTVNGIGPVLADRIISGRPYSSRKELVDRGIIGQSTFEELERQFARGERRSA